MQCCDELHETMYLSLLEKFQEGLIMIFFHGGVGENEKNKLQMLRECFLKERVCDANLGGLVETAGT